FCRRTPRRGSTGPPYESGASRPLVGGARACRGAPRAPPRGPRAPRAPRAPPPGAKVVQRLGRVLDPLLRVWSARRVREEGLQVLRRPVGIAALQQQKRQAVVRAGERAVELERAAVMPNRFVVAARLGERDRHVLENACVVGVIAQRQAVRRERRIVIALPLEG